MSAYTRSILKAIVSVMAPKHEKIPPDDDGLVLFLEKFIRHIPFYIRFSLLLGLYAFQFFPPLFLFSLRPFTRMPLEQRELYLATWATSRNALKKTFFRGVNVLCMIGFYSRPEVCSHIGYSIEDHIRSLM